MCGIVGIYNFTGEQPVTRAEIDQMCQVIPYRGPDGYGIHTEDRIGLGHRRLTIIDTSERSNQPMLGQTGEYAICYNGEVYNYLEIKEELVAAGVEFRTTSDTEVLLELLRRDGVEALSRLNGMYAFAYWDRVAERLVLVRDRLGIKPLYYTMTDSGIVFGSEIKSLLCHREVEARVNARMIDSYMSLGYTPTDETMFEGIFKLPPGYYLSIEKGQVDLVQYWDMQPEEGEDQGERYYLEEAERLLKDAVRIQQRSDVPLGVFLSGGVDSSAVVAIMRQSGVKNLKTFSVAWDYGADFNETRYARQVAQQFDTDHTEYMMSADDFRNFLPQYIRHMDEPVTEAAAISLYYLSMKAREQVTVILSGEGADEVFGGYPIYKYFQAIHYYTLIPRWMRRYLFDPVLSRLGAKWRKYLRISRLPLEESYAGVSFYDYRMKESLYTKEFAGVGAKHNVVKMLQGYYDKTRGKTLQKRMQYLDVKTWLVDDLLIKADRMSMAASLELRVPFLDHRFLEFAVKMPSRYRLRKGHNKYILKKAMEPYLDREILYRKKQGFPTPVSILFKHDLYDYVEEVLNSPEFRGRGYFDPDRVNKLLREHKSGEQDHHRVLWQLLVLELWHREFIDSRPAGSAVDDAA